MNRIQFYILVGLSSMLVVLLGLNLLLVHKVTFQQGEVSSLQQAFTQGRDVQQKLTQLIQRINVEVQKTPPNQALKDILTREQINIKAPDAGANANATDSSAAPAPAAPAPSATH